ncbi:MAG: hypothetical protein FWC09_03710 [Lachnospiraceae bacterium]|nr:hypothetical protein [Lachnospiraceae bacterium]
MVTTFSVEELPIDEQVRMSVEEAGKKYSGNFIFLTNTETKFENGRWVAYGIPRVIAPNNQIFNESGLSKKYRNKALYGAPYSCWVYMEEDQIPPILTF